MFYKIFFICILSFFVFLLDAVSTNKNKQLSTKQNKKSYKT